MSKTLKTEDDALCANDITIEIRGKNVSFILSKRASRLYNTYIKEHGIPSANVFFLRCMVDALREHPKDSDEYRERLAVGDNLIEESDKRDREFIRSATNDQKE